MRSERRDDPSQAAVFDFVSAYWEAREAGQVHDLAHWLARHPGHEQAIAREYLTLESPEPAPPDGVSERQVGPYLIVREIGSGGQGAVYLAQDTRIERTVALKVLSGFFGTIGEERRARLRREAEIIARLDHPGICAIHDAEIESDPPWLAMRHVEGMTLAALLASAKDPEREHTKGMRLCESWPARSVVDIHALLAFFEKAARALHAAHEAGVIHRDIKPGNIMVSAQGEPVLLDFGLAREEREEDAAALTMEGEMLGTPAYMSPEQLRAGAALDRRTDVYSLGATLYETLTLHRVFEKRGRSELFKAIEQEETRDPREHNPALPGEVSAVLAVALAKDPARRYASALEFAEDLRRIRVYEPIRARPPGLATRVLRWSQRNPWLAAAILVLTSALTFSLYTLASERAALRVALGRHLGTRASALLEEDPSAAVALGAQACELAPNYLTRAALLGALDACALERELRVPKARTSDDFAVDGGECWIAVALGGFADGAARLVLHPLQDAADPVELPGPHGAIQKLLWSQAHQRLISAEQDGRLQVFDPQTRQRTGQARLPGAVREWFLTRDGGFLIALTREGQLQVRSLPELELVRVLAERDCEAVRQGTRSSSVIVRDRNTRRLRELDLGTGGELAGWEAPQGGVRSFEIAQGALWIATPGNELARIELSSGSTTLIPLAPTTLSIEELRVDPDGGRLLALLGREERGAALLIDARTLLVTRLLPEDSRFALRGAFRADGARVALACSDMSVRIFDCASGALIQQFRGRFRAQDLAYSADGTRLYTRNVGGALMCWYANTRPDVLRLRAPGSIAQIRWNEPLGRFEALTSDGARHEFDAQCDVPLQTRPGSPQPKPSNRWDLHCGTLRELSGGRVVFEALSGGSGWEIDLSRPVPLSVRDIAAAPDGSELTLVTNSLRVLRVRVSDGSILEDLRPFATRSAYYSPDSRHLLLLGEHGGGAFRLLELVPGEKSRVLGSQIFHTADLCLGGFSPSGSVFVTASKDGTIYVRDTRGGLPRTRFQASGTPTALGFEGDRVLVGTAEGLIHGFPIDPLAALAGRLPRPLEEWEIANEQRLAEPLRYNP
ncbi:MAG: protein kinase domain-containing protein [Planctomycetia bacterium]